MGAASRTFGDKPRFNDETGSAGQAVRTHRSQVGPLLNRTFSAAQLTATIRSSAGFATRAGAVGTPEPDRAVGVRRAGLGVNLRGVELHSVSCGGDHNYLVSRSKRSRSMDGIAGGVIAIVGHAIVGHGVGVAEAAPGLGVQVAPPPPPPRCLSAPDGMSALPKPTPTSANASSRTAAARTAAPIRRGRGRQWPPCDSFCARRWRRCPGWPYSRFP